MKRNSTSAGLLIFLLLPAAFGCQLKAKGGMESGLTPTEQTNPAPKAKITLSLKDQDEKAALKLDKDIAAYGIGLDVGRSLLKQESKLNPDSLLLGLRDGLQRNKSLVPDQEMAQVRRAFLTERMLPGAKAMGAKAEKNLLEGEAFLRENAKKEGIISLPSGLQYRVIKEGTGKTPGIEKDVQANYVVRSIDGVELENTYKSGQPVVLPLQGVITAWAEALQLMKEGAKWELFAPSYLAYGDSGSDAIAPYQALVSEIELIKVH